MNFRDKAREIKAEGAAKRGTFDPQGKPKEWYQFWLANSETKKARDIRQGYRKENFCHFWRVVAIWAPLMFLRKKVEPVAHRLDGIGPWLFGLAALGFVIAIFVTEGWVGLGIMFAVLFGMAGVVAALVAVSFYLENHPELQNRLLRGLAWLAALGVPLFLIATIIKFFGLVGIILLAVGAVVGLLIYFNLSHIADWIEGIRIRNKRKENERRRAASDRAEAFYDEHGYWPHQKPKKAPGRVSKFFTAVGDFFIMAAQVVRVKKWGICPIVEIDMKETA